MSLHPISVAGLRPIAQVTLSHQVKFLENQNALSISLQLLASPHSGAPVVNAEGRFVGFISEFDLLAALESGRNLDQLKAKEIMVQDPKATNGSTTIAEAARIMKEHNVLVLPVEQDGVVVGSVTRRDLLSTWIQFALGQEPQ